MLPHKKFHSEISPQNSGTSVLRQQHRLCYGGHVGITSLGPFSSPFGTETIHKPSKLLAPGT